MAQRRADDDLIIGTILIVVIYLFGKVLLPDEVKPIQQELIKYEEE